MFIFIPDTFDKAGLGHINRCYKYARFIKNKKIIFLVKKNIDKKLINRKYKHIYYDNLHFGLKKLRVKNTNNCIILDTYNNKLYKNYNLRNYASNIISILDYKDKNCADIIIDHTYLRNEKFHYNSNFNQKFYVGHKYFPASENLTSKIQFIKKKIILIDFGSVKNFLLIVNALKFIKKNEFLKKYKIIIINKYFYEKNKKVKFKKNIQIYRFIKNINKIYEKTFFSFGGCGISLYEKSFYKIPTIAKLVADNQKYNFKHFAIKKNILLYDEIINKKFSKKNFIRKIEIIRRNLKKNFKKKKNEIFIKKIFNIV
jgi:spore coat polysaccharide biosynthesis predicted glycosyltransferase SpsG